MLWIRYDKQIRILTGWADKKADLSLRKGEAVASLSIAKPDIDDYELYCFIGGKLVDSSKRLPRNLATEFDDLKTKLKEKGVID